MQLKVSVEIEDLAKLLLDECGYEGFRQLLCASNRLVKQDDFIPFLQQVVCDLAGDVSDHVHEWVGYKDPMLADILWCHDCGIHKCVIDALKGEVDERLPK